jgi:hypothetical protein
MLFKREQGLLTESHSCMSVIVSFASCRHNRTGVCGRMRVTSNTTSSGTGFGRLASSPFLPKQTFLLTPLPSTRAVPGEYPAVSHLPFKNVSVHFVRRSRNAFIGGRALRPFLRFFEMRCQRLRLCRVHERFTPSCANAGRLRRSGRIKAILLAIVPHRSRKENCFGPHLNAQI